MTTIRRMRACDLFNLNSVNLDPLTENYNISFYLHYMAAWPDFQHMLETPDGKIPGYVMGKAEGVGTEWHGHVTAITVSTTHRRLGFASKLMYILETISEQIYNGFFVDLFVRDSNKLAIGMYEKFGYKLYRRVAGYYSGMYEEDGLDMRKALPRDVHKLSERRGKDVDASDL